MTSFNSLWYAFFSHRWKKLQSKRLKEEERRGQQQAGPGPSAPRPTARASDGRLLSVVKAEIESQKAYGN